MQQGKQKIHLILSRLGFAGFLISNAIIYAIKYTRTGKILTALLVLSIAIYFLYPQAPSSFTNPSSEKVILQIPNGAIFKQIADTLQSRGLLRSKRLFLLFGKISGKERMLRAGRFEVPVGLNEWELLHYLATATPARIKVTLNEGILSHEMAAILQRTLGIDSSKFVSLVYDSAFTGTLVPGVPNLEGFLLPETYYFEWKTPEEEIIKYLVEQTLEIFKPDSVQQQLKRLVMTPYQIIILASIIEGEAMVDSERVYISSVYHNRLRRGWRLQADPTIQFAIPGPPRRLLKKDLEIDSPYNTYKHRGLPPGPINNPGKQSILAALFPKSTSYLYMVAVGDGTHKFSRTLREHNYWHKKFNEVRRQVRRQQRRRALSP